jgi:hypothetical protein
MCLRCDAGYLIGSSRLASRIEHPASFRFAATIGSAMAASPHVILSGARDLAIEAVNVLIPRRDPSPCARSLSSFGMTEWPGARRPITSVEAIENALITSRTRSSPNPISHARQCGCGFRAVKDRQSSREIQLERRTTSRPWRRSSQPS